MPKVAPDTIPRTKQRTRRSHKNSKDGCPNCRAKRVKCGEELPSCLQCVRKKCRCGYLDFPIDKLEHLARKNGYNFESLFGLKGPNAVAASDITTELPKLTISQHGSSKRFIDALNSKDKSFSSYSLNSGSLILLLLSQPPLHRIQEGFHSHRSNSPKELNLRNQNSPMNPHFSELDQSLFPTDVNGSNTSLGQSMRSVPSRDRNLNPVKLRSPLNFKKESIDNELSALYGSNYLYLSKRSGTQIQLPQSIPSHLQQSTQFSQLLPMELHHKNQPQSVPHYNNLYIRQQQIPQQPTPPAHNANFNLQSHPQNQSFDPNSLQLNNYNPSLDVRAQGYPSASPMTIPTSQSSKVDAVAQDPHLMAHLMPHMFPLSMHPGNIQLSLTNPQQSLKTPSFSVGYSNAASPKAVPMFVPDFGGNSQPSFDQMRMMPPLGPAQYSNKTVEDLVFNHLHDLHDLHNFRDLHGLYNQHSSGILDMQDHLQSHSLLQSVSRDDQSLNLDIDAKQRNLSTRRSLVRVRDRERPDDERENPLRPLTRVRSIVYTNMFHAVNQEFGDLEELIPDDFQLWTDDKLFDSSDNLSIKSSDQFLLNQGLQLDDFETDKLNFGSSHSNSGVTPGSFSDNTTSNRNRAPSKGKPLPNAIVRRVRFLRLKVPEELDSPWNGGLALNTGTAEFGINTSKLVRFRPVWTEDHSHQFWLEIFKMAAVLDLYFQYFIDKSVNILVRAADAIVNGDIISFNLDLSSARSSDSLNDFFQFFYNKQDLRALTRKSFVTYGNLISKLRDAISLVGPQYTARMSLFSAYGCYMNPSPDLSSFILMFTGTIIVLKKLFDESQTQRIDASLKHQVMLINMFCLASRYPDYSFSVITELGRTFRTYKYYVQEQIDLYEKGMQLEDNYQKPLHDPIFHHDLKELDKFLNKLQTFYYPTICECNNYYKARYNYAQDSNIHFVSLSLIFDLACEWFRVYPGDKMSMGLRTDPLKKVLYLFYHALAKCLSHVLSPIKSLLIVDACNVTFTKVGMQFSRLNPSDLSPLNSLAVTLYKTIRFFENRLRLFGYYMEHSTVLDGKFIESVKSEPPAEWMYRDIAHVVPPKLLSGEEVVKLFSSCGLTIKNYAFMEELGRDSKYAPLIQAELNRQNYAIQHEPLEFLYDKGVSNHEFNPESIIERLNAAQDEMSDLNGPLSIQVIRHRIDNLLLSRNEAAQIISRYRKRA